MSDIQQKLAESLRSLSNDGMTEEEEMQTLTELKWRINEMNPKTKKNLFKSLLPIGSAVAATIICGAVIVTLKDSSHTKSPVITMKTGAGQPKHITNVHTGATNKDTNVQSQLALKDMRIGNLYIGMPLSEVKQLYGPGVKGMVHGNGDVQTTYKKNGFVENGDPVWQLTINKPFSGSTPKGIHIGSTDKEVELAYPGIQSHQLPDGTWLIANSSDRKYTIMFQVVHNVVNSISINKSLVIN